MSKPVAIQKRGVTFFVDADARCSAPGMQQDWYMHWWKHTYPKWEPQTFIVFNTFLDVEKSFIDVGAWIGPTVLYAAAKAKHVYCFEPDPEAYRVLSMNLGVNPRIKNVTVFNAALSRENGVIAFGGNGALGNSESTMLVNDPTYTEARGEVLRTGDSEREKEWRNSGTVQVATRTIESIEEQHNLSDCGFMKIDIEGGEKIVVPALEPFLKRVRPTLYVSIHWMYLSQAEIEALYNMLSALYPAIYDDSLLRRVSKERLVQEKISSIVCTAHGLSLTQTFSVLCRTAALKIYGFVRRIAIAVLHR